MKGTPFYLDIDFLLTLLIAVLALVAVIAVMLVMRHRHNYLAELRRQHEAELAAARVEERQPVYFRRYIPGPPDVTPREYSEGRSGET